MYKILLKHKYLLCILVASIILSIPLLQKNLNVYYDDGIQHISRAYVTYITLKSGENINILPALCNGFGYSWNLFYGPLSTTLILIFKLFTTSFIGAYKIVLFIGILLSRNNNVWLYERKNTE